ncbi:MAG: MATE family efflux transporter [Deltaproteobacteria bacterium]|nr:MAG: MATE family efflux transporter [Deltaproteobacteria bacterium]
MLRRRVGPRGRSARVSQIPCSTDLFVTSASTFRIRHPELARLLVLAGPLVVARLSHVLMGFVDTWMAGTLGTEAVAAIGLGHTIWFLGFVFAIGTLMGIEPLIASAMGRSDEERAGAIFAAGRWVAVGLMPLLVLLAVLGPWAAEVLGQPEEVRPLLVQYLGVVAFAVPAALLFQVMSTAVAALGWSRPLLLISLAGNGVNIVTNVVFVHGIGPVPALGVAGIALATVLSSVVMWVLLHRAMASAQRARALRRPWERPRWADVRQALGIGVPVGVQYGLEVAGFTAATVMMGWFGAAALAAHQVALSVISVSFTVALGLGTAAGILVARAEGRGDIGLARRTGRMAFGCGAVVALVAAGVLVAGRSFIAGAFLEEPAALALAVSLLWMAAIFQVADSVQAVAFGLLRGLGDTRVPLLFNVVGYWVVGLPVGGWLALQVLGRPEPIWAGLTVALFLVAGAALLRFERGLAARES